MEPLVSPTVSSSPHATTLFVETWDQHLRSIWPKAREHLLNILRFRLSGLGTGQTERWGPSWSKTTVQTHTSVLGTSLVWRDSWKPAPLHSKPTRHIWRIFGLQLIQFYSTTSSH